MADAPYDDREGWIWMDGDWRPWREARVHVLTHALHYASSVFEGERAYGGVIFESRKHSERLKASANALGFDLPIDLDALDRLKHEAIQRNGLSDAYIRPVAWRGSEMMGVSAQSNTIHLAIAVWNWGAYYGRGAHQRPPGWIWRNGGGRRRRPSPARPRRRGSI